MTPDAIVLAEASHVLSQARGFLREMEATPELGKGVLCLLRGAQVMLLLTERRWRRWEREAGERGEVVDRAVAVTKGARD